MSKVLKHVLEANRKYAAGFAKKSELKMPPALGMAILTCMDARMDPSKFAGLAEGDAHVIRNAGGRASDDAIRSLVVSHKLQGTREWFVIHHTECGQRNYTNEVMHGLLSESLKTASFENGAWKNPGAGPGSREGEFIEWLTIRNAEEAVVSDVLRIKSHPLVPPEVVVYGYIFDVKTGRLVEVPKATAAGAAKL